MSENVKTIMMPEIQKMDIDRFIVNGIIEETLNVYKQILSAEKNNNENVGE
jgi:hypothetical protein